VRGNLAQIKMSSTKVVYLRSYNIEDPSVRVQALCLTFGGNIVLPAHAVPSIRELYHRKWVITLLAALGPGSSFSLKKHFADRLLAGGWTTCKKLASASPVSDCFSHPLGSLHFLIAGS